jgi:hypothetical protein
VEPDVPQSLPQRRCYAILRCCLVASSIQCSRDDAMPLTAYRDLGEAYLDQIDQNRTAANLKRRLERLGYIVQLQPREAAAV